MRCFYHRDQDAVGTCKACQKGLCGACAVDVSNGLACRDRCEEIVRSTNALIERNIRISPVSEQLISAHAGKVLVAGVFAIVGGILFVMLGMNLRGTGSLGITAIGVLVILGGLWQLGSGWRLKRQGGQT